MMKHLMVMLVVMVCLAPATRAGEDHEAESLRLAIQDLSQTFGPRYAHGAEYLKRLDALANHPQRAVELQKLRQEALLTNPLLDFDRLLLVRRTEREGKAKKALGLPQNWEGDSSLPPTGYDNEIATLSPISPEGKLTTLYKPGKTEFVGDMKLHFDASRLMFSMPSATHRWRVWEMGTDGKNLRAIDQIDEADVDNYDACYLPDGNVIFSSTAPFNGVPCVTGSAHVANLYLLNSQSGAIRQLTFDQDHDWCPTVLNNGRVMYLRWEYSDIPHFVSRILFHMNPDGTEQMEYYGSNSYWPNAMFYAKPIPGSATKFVAIVGGHHGSPRMGELVLFDIAKGRHEASGAIQRIPGRGKIVEPIIKDQLVDASWPKFLHPYPLSEKYFLVSAKLNPEADWGIYLVDVFDNMTLIKSLPGQALFEPVPLRKTATPPVIPSRVDPEKKDATVYIADIYSGQGLQGIPRGTVRNLRLFTYQFAYHGMGGQTNRVGIDGPWDIKRIIGTVPVEPDGSALFKVPANTPISVQPLDADGQAMQLMRSWFTAMPGETVSCAGCHDRQNSSASPRQVSALQKSPAEIKPWYGPTRGFSFVREVQPVLDHYCVSCHDGRKTGDAATLSDLRDAPPIHPVAKQNHYMTGTQFTPSYLELKRFVRNATMESDINLLTPMEYSANTTALVQMLRRGHYDVKLSAEALDRLITWIDLNTPAHGTWHEIVGEQKVCHFRDRRREMMKLYAGRDEDPEFIDPTLKALANEPVLSSRAVQRSKFNVECSMFKPEERTSNIEHRTLNIELGPNVAITLIRLPKPQTQNPKPNPAPGLYFSTTEITNAQYAAFDPAHDSRLERGEFLHFSQQERGEWVNQPDQPVVRVSWERAMQFCQWLSKKSGKHITLPTDDQWLYACRAGTSTPFWFGEVNTDFSPYANLADIQFHQVSKYGWELPSGAISPWRPAVPTVNDGHRVSAPVGHYKSNPWGLYDMVGNVWEWTRSEEASTGQKIARGGSWYDRPSVALQHLSYPSYQRVYNVGFRVVMEDDQ